MRRVLALLALVAMVVVPPVLLVAWGFTDWGSIRLWSITDVRVLMAMLTVLGWVAWAVWVASVTVEAVSALSGRTIRWMLPGLAWPRALAAGLIATAMATGTAPAPAQAQAPISSTVVVSKEARVAVPSDERGTTASEIGGRQDDAPTPLAASATPEGQVHTVQPGDDLWSLAEHYLGDGGRWRALVAANAPLQADPLTRLVPGTQLVIPVPATAVTVEAGDTLSGLAREHLGDGHRWPELHAVNADLVSDPDLIHPGWVLQLPSATSEEEAPAEAGGQDATDDVVTGTAPEIEAVEAGLEPMTASTSHDGQEPAGESGTGTATAPERLAPASDAAPFAALLGGIGALTAAAVMGGIGAHRRLQARARPLGRRYAQPAGELARYETALVRQAAAVSEVPSSGGDGTDRMMLLDRAMRLLTAHAVERGEPVPPLHRVLVGADDVEFQFIEAPEGSPDGFLAVGDSLVAGWPALREQPTPDLPVAYPALVTLGERSDGLMVMIDVLASGVLGIRGDENASPGEVISAMLVELACAPWASDLDLLVVTGDPAFARVTGEDRVVCGDDAEAGVASVERLTDARSARLDSGRWEDFRLNPELADAWTPHVALFELVPDAAQLARLEAAIADRPCGVAAIVPVGAQAASADWVLTVDPDGTRRVAHDDAHAIPQTVPAATRTALSELHSLAVSTDTEPAPWWPAPSEDDVNIIALRPAIPPVRGPRLSLLGPVELAGCAGTPPARAVRQCLEYCAWLLLNPGSTAVQMTHALLVADGTRRSNMSRLRTWLGSDAEGSLYLPDAYSGRIALHPDVTSDWEELRLLTEGGINHLPLDRLVAALELVRGAPLADAAPASGGGPRSSAPTRPR
ncbi:MAG: LysM peptidoglycan-binding domain-containing protein [Propioniciclava sp.]|uniref:LysM peptidoglycan-binding domain-containing protein n=1 Tax=Propioniciclava sp. TaxID=2038686 RepID=UPI0039E6CB16